MVFQSNKLKSHQMLISKLASAFLIIVFLITSCERSTIKTPQEAMRLVENPPVLSDDLPLTDLGIALQQKIDRLKEIDQKQIVFGPKTIDKNDDASLLINI